MDTESTGLNPWQGDRPFAVSMCDENGRTWFRQWDVDPFTREVTPDPKDIAFLRALFSGKKGDLRFVFHNRPFDTRMFAAIGIVIDPNLCEDTNISARVINGLESQYSLKYLSDTYLGLSDKDEKDLLNAVKSARKRAQVWNTWVAEPSGRPQIKLGKNPHEDFWLLRHFEPNSNLLQVYAETDVIRTMGLWLLHQHRLSQDELFAKEYEFEQSCFETTDAISNRGMRVDPVKIEDGKKKAQLSMTKHENDMLTFIRENKIYPWEPDLDQFPEIEILHPWAVSKAKSTRTIRVKYLEIEKARISPEGLLSLFNPRSASQIRRILFLPREYGGLGLPPTRWTKSGPGIDKGTLRGLMYEPFVRSLMAYRTAKQAYTLFFSKYQSLMVLEGKKLGRSTYVLHTNLQQAGAAPTGRYSSGNPNLQNVRTLQSGSVDESGELYDVRSAFVPREGCIISAFDYAQQEVRIFIALGKIKSLLKKINEGQDPYSSITNTVWGGKNNGAALEAAAIALELGREQPSNELIRSTWEGLGWDSKAAKEFGFTSRRSLDTADLWLREFDYDIVLAEASLDRKLSRHRSKCTVLANLYGSGPVPVAGLLRCTIEDAKKFLYTYNRTFPDIHPFARDLQRKARLDGYIINPYGRKIQVDPEFIYRATNYMVQSTAASQMKNSLRNVYIYLKSLGVPVYLLATIHDEIQLEGKRKYMTTDLFLEVKKIMEDNEGRIPGIHMRVDVSLITEDWSRKKELIL